MVNGGGSPLHELFLKKTIMLAWRGPKISRKLVYAPSHVSSLFRNQ